METAQDRLVRYIQDAHAAEVGIADVLKGFIKEISLPEAKMAFEEHLKVTVSQASRLEARLSALGAEPSGGKGFVNMLLAKMSDMMHAAHDEEDKVTQDLIKAYATEHLEIGMYTSLQSYAEAVGDRETAALAQQIMSEEKEAAEKVFPMIAAAAKTPLNKVAA